MTIVRETYAPARRGGALSSPIGRVAADPWLFGIFVLVTVSVLIFSVLPVLTVLGVALGVATCLLLARASLAIAALVLRERRSRELTGLFLVALLVVVVPVGVFLASLRWQGRVPTQLAEAVEVLALTPVGAPWAVSSPPTFSQALRHRIAIGFEMH